MGEAKQERAWVASERTDSAGTRVTASTARELMEEETMREAAARVEGLEEYDSVLPEYFPRTGMDIEGHGVFSGCASNGDQYPYILHREVARDPVARLFGRMSALEAGGVVRTRRGREVKMDAENMRILTGQGNTAQEQR